MKTERLIWLLAMLALAGGGWWLSANTEWVEEHRPRDAQGEARDNPTYAFEQLLRRLGMTVAHKEALDGMPPPQARLLLLSNDWQLMPGRAEQLHQWVLGGGHLVLMQPRSWDDTALADWVPVDQIDVKLPEKAAPKPAPPPPPPKKKKPRPSWATAPALPQKRGLASTPPLWGGTDWIFACHAFYPEWVLRTRPGHAATWTLTLVDRKRKTQTQALLAQQDQALRPPQSSPPVPPVQAVRVPIGQGSVTVINAYHFLVYNQQALDCDNPLLLAAAVQAEPGATAWIYLQEKREALLPWLWHSGWIAIVAGGLALAAALWRAAVRFGPRLAPAPRLRRSISEQVRGLGAYLHGGGREALLTAQQRALTEQATRSLPRFARLPVAGRAQAIAQATGLAAGELASALSARFCTRLELSQHLQALETARRRLHRPPDERRRTP